MRGRRHPSAAPSGMLFFIPNSFASLVEFGTRNGLKHQAQYRSETNSTVQESPGKGEASVGAKTGFGLGVLVLDTGKHLPSVAASELRGVQVNWGFGDLLDLIHKPLEKHSHSLVPHQETGKMP